MAQQGSVIVLWGGILAVMAFLLSTVGTIFTAILAPFAIYFGISFGKSLGDAEVAGKRELRMSFVSEALARGAFPPEARIPEPTMHAILWFHELPEKKDVAKLFQEVMPLKPYSRLHSVLRLHRGEIEFKEIPLSDFDVMARFKEHTAKDENEIVQIAEDMLQVNMDSTQPLWEMHFVKNIGNGRSALIPKIHHAVGDGLSMVGLFLNFFKNEDGSQTVLTAMKEPKVGGKLDYLDMAAKVLASLGKVLSLPASPFDTITKLTALTKALGGTSAITNEKLND